MASTILTLIVVPAIYYLVYTRGGRAADITPQPETE